jgi:glucokinase
MDMKETNQTSVAIAIDIGGTKISGGVITESGELLANFVEKTPEDVDTLIEVVSTIIANLITSITEQTIIRGIGLAVAGTVEWEQGVVVQSPNLPYDNLALKSIVEKAFDLPTYLDNDGNLAVLGEKYFGNARDSRNVVGLTLGTGIGAGIIIDNKLYRGATGSAAELGHMVINSSGPSCTCGSFGCFEELASGRALVRYAKQKLSGNMNPGNIPGYAANDVPDSKSSLLLDLVDGVINKIDGIMITKAALAGDKLAISCFEDVGYWLGVGLTNIINIFNPEVIVVGGGMADAGELVLNRAREVVASHSLSPNKEVVSIVKAKLSNNAGLFGAAALVFNK